MCENPITDRSPVLGVDRRCSLIGSISEIFAAVGAEDVVFARQETSAHQRHAASFAVEAVVVPLALLERDVLTASETWERKATEGSHE